MNEIILPYWIGFGLILWLIFALNVFTLVVNAPVGGLSKWPPSNKLFNYLLGPQRLKHLCSLLAITSLVAFVPPQSAALFITRIVVSTHWQAERIIVPALSPNSFAELAIGIFVTLVPACIWMERRERKQSQRRRLLRLIANQRRLKNLLSDKDLEIRELIAKDSENSEEHNKELTRLYKFEQNYRCLAEKTISAFSAPREIDIRYIEADLQTYKWSPAFLELEKLHRSSKANEANGYRRRPKVLLNRNFGLNMHWAELRLLETLSNLTQSKWSIVNEDPVNDGALLVEFHLEINGRKRWCPLFVQWRFCEKHKDIKSASEAYCNERRFRIGSRSPIDKDNVKKLKKAAEKSYFVADLSTGLTVIELDGEATHTEEIQRICDFGRDLDSLFNGFETLRLPASPWASSGDVIDKLHVRNTTAKYIFAILARDELRRELKLKALRTI